jgi:SAM-dependent methyltransferase
VYGAGGEGVVIAGTAEAIPVDSDSVDAVFVGEAFHWFDASRAIAEIARVLVPRGRLALISTHWWETEPELPESAMILLREPFTRFSAERPPGGTAPSRTPLRAAALRALSGRDHGQHRHVAGALLHDKFLRSTTARRTRRSSMQSVHSSQALPFADQARAELDATPLITRPGSAQ